MKKLLFAMLFVVICAIKPAPAQALPPFSVGWQVGQKRCTTLKSGGQQCETLDSIGSATPDGIVDTGAIMCQVSCAQNWYLGRQCQITWSTGGLGGQPYSSVQGALFRVANKPDNSCSRQYSGERLGVWTITSTNTQYGLNSTFTAPVVPGPPWPW